MALSQLFLGQDYWSDLEIYYSDKLYNVFNPSVRELYTIGINVSKAVKIVEEYCDIVFTGDTSVDARYKANMQMEYVSQGLNCLDTYGDGPERLYHTIDRYFRKVCDYLKQGVESKDVDAIDFFNDKSDEIEDLLRHADNIGYGMGFSMQQAWDEVCRAVED